MSEKSLEVLKLEHKRKLQVSLQVMATTFIISLGVIEFEPSGNLIHSFIKTVLILVVGWLGLKSIKKHMEDLKEIEKQVDQK